MIVKPDAVKRWVGDIVLHDFQGQQGPATGAGLAGGVGVGGKGAGSTRYQ